MKYLEFNNYSSTDFGLGILSVNLGVPSPNLIIEKLPYCNGSFDFSTVATGGLVTYSDRVITVDFNYIEKNQTKLYETFSKVSSWLLSGPKGNLTFNYINGFYTGRCTQISDLKTFILLGKFTATFTCDPFLNCGAYGEWLWNPFNFNIDKCEINQWIVNKGDSIKLINRYLPINPEIIVDDNMTISLNDKKYTFKMGSNKIFGFILATESNNLKVLDCAPNSKIIINFTKQLL